MYRAIGINFDNDGFTNSHAVDSDQPQTVADHIQQLDQTRYDQILLLKNGDSCPQVAAYWLQGTDYGTAASTAGSTHKEGN